MERVKRPRIVLQPSPGQLTRWEEMARHWRRPLPKFIVFLLDVSVRYDREIQRGRKTNLDKYGLRMSERERLQKAAEKARDALIELVERLA